MKTMVPGVLVAMLLSGCGGDERTHILIGEAMGTSYRIKTIQRADAVLPAIEAMLAELDRDLSTWREDSWVAEFNRAPAGTRMEMPEPVALLLQLSEQYHEQTGGRFDPTVGALIRLWGFGAWRGQWGGEPADEELAAAMAASGFDNLRIEDRDITKLHAGLMLDFSAIAKGHAVDQMARLLCEAGHQDFIIDFGGDVLAAGNRPGGGGWIVGGPSLEKPIALHDQAIASSGSEHNFRADVTHVIDPHSGRPLPVGAPVAVIAPTCAEADALATARMVEQAVLCE